MIEVYNREECTFNYCPTPTLCPPGCQHPVKSPAQSEIAQKKAATAEAGNFVIRLSHREEMETIMHLFAEHREELTTNKELMILKPDMVKYEAARQMNKLFALVAVLDGKIIGYSVNFVDSNLHYSDMVQCQNDVLFLTAEHRGSRYGVKLREETKREGKSRGAAIMLWHAKPGTPMDQLMQAMVRKQRAKVQDLIYSEVL